MIDGQDYEQDVVKRETERKNLLKEARKELSKDIALVLLGSACLFGGIKGMLYFNPEKRVFNEEQRVAYRELVKEETGLSKRLSTLDSAFENTRAESVAPYLNRDELEQDYLNVRKQLYGVRADIDHLKKVGSYKFYDRISDFFYWASCVALIGTGIATSQSFKQGKNLWRNRKKKKQ